MENRSFPAGSLGRSSSSSLLPCLWNFLGLNFNISIFLGDQDRLYMTHFLFSPVFHLFLHPFSALEHRAEILNFKSAVEFSISDWLSKKLLFYISKDSCSPHKHRKIHKLVIRTFPSVNYPNLELWHFNFILSASSQLCELCFEYLCSAWNRRFKSTSGKLMNCTCWELCQEAQHSNLNSSDKETKSCFG